MGYLDRLPDGRYQLGLKMLEFAFIINQNLGYPKAVYDILVETASQTGEIVYFGLPYGDRRALPLRRPPGIDRMGVLPYRDILGETAPLLLHRHRQGHPGPSCRKSEWLPAHQPGAHAKYQPGTITDYDAIVDELRTTRQRGYALDNGERDPDVRCVGVPVYNRLRPAGGEA